MDFRFLKAGLQTCIQDLGRQGVMHQGISHCGAMDTQSFTAANWLVSNPINSPIFEICLVGPTIEFYKETKIAITGANFDVLLNGHPIDCYQAIKIKAGDTLTFGKLNGGARAYLAVSGLLETVNGHEIKKVLGSYSTHITAKYGSCNGKAVQVGDSFTLSSNTNENIDQSTREWQTQHIPQFKGRYLIRCVKTVETDSFSEGQLTHFFQQKYSISAQSNRMGIRLSGEPLVFDKTIDIFSSGLTLGSIQIPPSGQPIISSVDGQTIGGYPRIANVISADLPLLGQLKPSDKVNFVLRSKSEALNILKKQKSFFEQLLNY